MTPVDEKTRLQAMNAVLRSLVRHASVLQREAFDDLAATIGAFVPFLRMAMLVPEGPDHRRVYAIIRAPEKPLPFGARIGVNPEVVRAVYDEGRPFFCDDTRLGTPAERVAADAGALSFVDLPMRDDGGKTIAELAFSFAAVAGARSVDVTLLQEIADAVGMSLEQALLRTRDRRLAMILETSGDAMLAWDRDGRVNDANAAAATLTGRARTELLGTPITELLAPVPDGGGPLELLFGACGIGAAEPADRTSHSQGVRLDLMVRSPDAARIGGARPALAPGDASVRRVVVAATITAVDDDALVAAHALLRDLSHVVAAERVAAAHLSRIHEIEEQHRTLLDNAPLIIFRLDPCTAELVYLNRHAERLLGVPTAEAFETPGFLRAAHADPEGVDAFDEAVARARRGAPAQPYEARLTRRRGEAINARGTVYSLLDERGQVAAIEGVLADVSAENAARTRLVQSDRLATLGTLAAGVAHEINNPAAFILLGLDLLDRLLHGPGVEMETAVAANAAELVHELRDSIRRIVDIARDLRLFASPPAPDGGRRTIVDVNRTVDSALSLTRGQILERAQVVRQLEEVPPVLMDDGRLGQVVVNLLVNAAQSIPKSYARDNRITVATRSDGNTVEIVVEDTGVGISKENLGRIWQPFFTTKGPDGGTGLGLSISREIVERAGGEVRVESPPTGPLLAGPLADGVPRGCRFIIALPVASGGDSPQPASSPHPGVPTTRARVLIVEDEPALARALADEIGRIHEVEVAAGAMAALALLDERRFDAILCDLRMPGMSGEALYAKVEERDEAQARAFLFMTGVGFGADVERFLASAGRPVLEKPFSAATAIDAIAKVVARNRKR